MTFRLIDAIPAHLRRGWEEERLTWLKLHPRPWAEKIEREYHERFSGQIERWLDAGHGSCLLRNLNHARIVDQAIKRFDGNRFSLIASIIMPNHVHALVIQKPGYPLQHLLRGWKSSSARVINRNLGQTGAVWQKDYFDRFVRNQEHLTNCVHYLRRNPRKAGLRKGEYLLAESDLAKQII